MNYRTKLIKKGDKYGKLDQLTHDEDRPLIEIYDADAFGGTGQLVSSYYAETFRECVDSNSGLDLCGYVESWKLDAAQVQEIAAEYGWTNNEVTI